MVRFLVLGAALLGVARGASEPIVGVMKTNCTMVDGFIADACFLRFQKFMDWFNDNEIDVERSRDIRRMDASCGRLRSCFPMVHCNKKKLETKMKLARDVVTLCDGVIFFRYQINACVQKLHENQSVCLEEWDGLPLVDSIPMNWREIPDDEEEIQKQFDEELKIMKQCDELLGPDHCIKREIIEHCDEKTWNTLQNRFFSLNHYWAVCDAKSNVFV